MKLTVDKILTSTATCSEIESYKLGLYVAMNENSRFYYTENHKNKLIIELAEIYFNEFAYITILGNSVYNPNPIHVLRFKHLKNNTSVQSNVLLYSNGAVSYDQCGENSAIHVWIDRSTVQIFDLPDDKKFKSLL